MISIVKTMVLGVGAHPHPYIRIGWQYSRTPDERPPSTTTLIVSIRTGRVVIGGQYYSQMRAV